MDYTKMKVAELRETAEKKGVRDISGLKKAELVELLTNIDARLKARSEKKKDDEKKAPAEKKDPVKKKAVKKIREKESAKSAKSKTANKKDEEKTVEKNTEKTSEKTLDKPAKKAVEKPVNKPAKKATEKPVEKTVKKTTEKPVDQTAKKVTEKSSKKSVKKTTDKPSDKTKEKIGASHLPQEGKPAEISSETAADVTSAGDQVNTVEQDKEEKPAEQVRPARPEKIAKGILEIMAEGYGFIRSDNYLPGEQDVYISHAQIRKFGLRTGDIIEGPIRNNQREGDKYSALLYIASVNGQSPDKLSSRRVFEKMTPIFPNERIHLDYDNAPTSLRIVDLFSPIGKGQRGMIVSPPKAGKTTLLKQIAQRICSEYPKIHLLVLLIDERPEEVTDIKESIVGDLVEVIYSTFDELPEHHKRVSEMTIERAKRLVEYGEDVVILIDSITRLARAYNLTVQASGRTLSGGLDPAALHMPKKFFGAARNMREGGSLTILATALIDTGSRMDDMVFEEFKGTGNMELVLDRKLSERRVFPAIDIVKSGTRKDDLLVDEEEQNVVNLIHDSMRDIKPEVVAEDIVRILSHTKNNREFMRVAEKTFRRRP